MISQKNAIKVYNFPYLLDALKAQYWRQRYEVSLLDRIIPPDDLSNFVAQGTYGVILEKDDKAYKFYHEHDVVAEETEEEYEHSQIHEIYVNAKLSTLTTKEGLPLIPKFLGWFWESYVCCPILASSPLRVPVIGCNHNQPKNFLLGDYGFVSEYIPSIPLDLIIKKLSFDHLNQIIRHVLEILIIFDEAFGFTHYDLNLRNILLVPCDLEYISYSEKIPLSGFRPILVDFSFAHVGGNGNFSAGEWVTPERYPAHDIYSLIRILCDALPSEIRIHYLAKLSNLLFSTNENLTESLLEKKYINLYYNSELAFISYQDLRIKLQEVFPLKEKLKKLKFKIPGVKKLNCYPDIASYVRFKELEGYEELDLYENIEKLRLKYILQSFDVD